jgi:hypothetical protein
LFYSLVKAIFDFDFNNAIDDRSTYLKRFCESGFFLIDAVDYPINKSKDWVNIRNIDREEIIRINKFRFLKRISMLSQTKHISSETKVILIKESVYKTYNSCDHFNIQNKGPLPFPSYYKEPRFVAAVKSLIT